MFWMRRALFTIVDNILVNNITDFEIATLFNIIDKYFKRGGGVHVIKQVGENPA